MAKWFNDLLGVLMPESVGSADVAPPAQPTRAIPGADRAPELCMLAEDWEAASFEDWAAAWRTHERVTQVKVDGINSIYVDGLVAGGREGYPLDCALHCQPGLARLEQAYGKRMVFFGEYSAHDGFNATLSEQAARKGGGAFWLYDAVPFDAWRTGHDYLVPIEERLARLREKFTAADTGMFVGMLDHWMLDGPATLAKVRELWAAGYEGVVSKAPGSPFTRRRNGDWLKIKEQFRAPCAVVDVMMKAGRLHRVIVRGPEPGGSKPLTLSRGWDAREEERIAQAVSRHCTDRLVVDVAFELTVGAKRTVRGATFQGLLA